MIQRIQTVYLFAAAALLVATWFAGTLDSLPSAALPWFLPAVGAMLGVGALVALGAIFAFGNRSRQRNMVLLAQFVAVLAAAGVFVGQLLTDSIPGVETTSRPAMLAVVLPLASIIALRFGRRAIERDIKLIKSMDRLR